jgi:hypothetical protein
MGTAAARTADMRGPAAGRSALAVGMNIVASSVPTSVEKINVGPAAVISAVVVTAITSIDIADTSRQGHRQDDHQNKAGSKSDSVSQMFCYFHKEFFLE